jgi:Cu+-exporting ATPase
MILKNSSNPQDSTGKYDFLDNEHKLLEFQENSTAIISLVFHIFIAARVFGFWKIYSVFRKEYFTGKFPEKRVRITFNPVVSIKTIVYLLSSIGYEPTLV